ncbi:MAG: FtsQ-type POTRA domain-containing protein [Clostridia bacterium]|nr:FtsQ-type POTRA domain-containing protein [Clostridia bacterium]MBR2328232.1 FtsQ-type POTRA domain-containing protein [Clostridia bacterium]
MKKTVKKRRSYVRRKRGGTGIAILGVLLAVALFVTVFLLAKIRTVELEGDCRYTLEELVAECEGLGVGEGILTVNEKAVRKALIEKFPYIEEVKVKRNYARLSVTLEITESKEAVSFKTESGFIILDKNGKVLAIKESKPNLPELIGAGITEFEEGKTAVFKDDTAHRIYKALWEEILNAELADKINEINISKRYNITFDYMAKIIINLGNADNIAKKITAAQICIKDNESDEGKAEIKFQDDTAKTTIYHPLTDEEWIDIKLNG